MGRDKAQLPLGKITALEFLIVRLRQVCDEVIVVTRPEQRYAHLQARVLFDVMPGTFSLGGLYSGLLQSPAETNFVCACDMPMIAPPLVSHLFARASEFDAIVTEIDGRAEPLCAVYNKSCLPFIHARLCAKDLRMSGWLASVRTHFVGKNELQQYDPKLRSFLNLNTAADYEQLLAYLKDE